MRKFFTFICAALMSVSLLAEQAIVVFEGNGHRKEVTVELSRTFWCNHGSCLGELDLIIQELYELPLGGRCVCEYPGVSGGSGAVTAGLSSNNQYISIDEAFNGSATVTGRYDRRINYSEVSDNFEGFDYSLTISIYFPEQVIVIPTNTGSASYSQDGITITCGDGGDHRGFLIGSDKYTHIIYPSSGYLRISQIELTPGSDKSNHSYVRANGDAPTSSSESSILFTNVIGNDISLSMNWGSIYISEVKVTLRDADTPADPRILGGDAEFPVSNNVSITCATGSSTIYYTLDGSDPITSPTKIKYTTAFTITSTTTVKAAAYRDGAWSSVVEKTFTKQAAVDIPANGDPQHPGVYYSTFYDSQVKYALPEGVEAYVATISGTDLIMTKIADAGQTIPKDNAVILKATVSAFTLTPSEAEPVTFDATNSLTGSDDPIGTPAHCYVLAGGSTDHTIVGVGFYPYEGAQIVAHRAYAVLGSGAPKRLRFVFDTATGVEEAGSEINTVRSEKILRNGQLYLMYKGTMYNAQGQVVIK